MDQKSAWEKEYRNPTFLTKEMEPQADTVRFFKFLKKEENVELEGKKLLDLGCGTGRNSLYAHELGLEAHGIDISKNAISHGLEYAKRMSVAVDLQVGSIGEKLSFANEEFDILLDVTSSNSLSEKEREIYLEEMYRMLRPGGYVYVKALCKEGDTNAKELLKRFPGPEVDTYILPEQKITERVWTKKDFTDFYSRKFKIIHLEMKETYTTMGDRKYKRRFWMGYLKKEV
ncbi:MAG: class I SAM-dependent methyltransferase [Candidatus Zambryskibacteria bacterium]|nr:class I SAM-dependent methyltransferase [Candidatus Zambryskibacteria bacterium]